MPDSVHFVVPDPAQAAMAAAEPGCGAAARGRALESAGYGPEPDADGRAGRRRDGMARAADAIDLPTA